MINKSNNVKMSNKKVEEAYKKHMEKWLKVDGDVDDFIFYKNEKTVSDR